MQKNKKAKNAAVLAIFLFVAILAIADFGGLFSIYHTTTGTTLNVGDKVYYKPQVFDTGGMVQSGAGKSGSETTLYNKLAAGEYCYAIQTVTYGVPTLQNAITVDSTRHIFKATPTSSAGGKYYELNEGSLYFTSFSATTAYSTVRYYCGNSATLPILMDTTRKYTFVSSGGITQTCNEADCNAKSTNTCTNEMLTPITYRCIEGQCVKGGGAPVANTECKNKYWTSICASSGKIWDGSSCIAPKAEESVITLPIPIVPSQAKINCAIASGTWDAETASCMEAIDIADSEGAETGTNLGAGTGIYSPGTKKPAADFISQYGIYIAGGIIVFFAWASGLMVYLGKK